jgi:hypothetical protein
MAPHRSIALNILRAIREGWQQGEWVWKFSLYLIPMTVIAGFLAYAIEGNNRNSDSPSKLFWVLCSIAAIMALKLAFPYKFALTIKRFWLGIRILVLKIKEARKP